MGRRSFLFWVRMVSYVGGAICRRRVDRVGVLIWNCWSGTARSCSGTWIEMMLLVLRTIRLLLGTCVRLVRIRFNVRMLLLSWVEFGEWSVGM